EIKGAGLVGYGDDGGGGHVDERRGDVGPAGGGQMVQGGVEDVVAHERAGGVGDRGGETGCEQRRDGVLDRRGGEVGRRAAGHDGLVDRLGAGVVGDPGVGEVERHPLGGQVRAPAGAPARYDGDRGV